MPNSTARIVFKERQSVRVDQFLADLRGNPFGNTWYVNSSTGSDTYYKGYNPLNPFATIAKAVAAASAGDTIVLLGSFNECVGASKAGLRFLGVGTGPNQSIWTAPDDGYCALVTATNILFNNIKFRPPAYTASPLLCTITSGTGTVSSSPVALTIGSNTPTFSVAGTATILLPAGITGTAASNGATVTGSPVTLTSGGSTTITTTTTGTVTITLATVPAAIQLGVATNNVADYARITNCRFQGKTSSYVAVSAPCPQDNIRIEDSEFFYLNNITSVYGTAVLAVQDATYNAFSSWIIKNNLFAAPVQGIKLPGRHCQIINNHFEVNGLKADATLGAVTGSAGSKKMIDLRGNATECNCNHLHGNYLGGTYNRTLYMQAYSTSDLDDWAGNYNIAGITAANPST